MAAVGGAVVGDASMARGRVRTEGGEVVPVYVRMDPVDRSDPTEPMLVWKHFPVEESPRKWPEKITS